MFDKFWAPLLACAFIAVVQTASAQSATPITPENAFIEVARSGKEAFLTWKIPDGKISALEIFRNTSESTKGRGRVASVRSTVNILLDPLPDSDTTYWYWVKIIWADGTHTNVGPVATPSGAVWQPSL